MALPTATSRQFCRHRNADAFCIRAYTRAGAAPLLDATTTAPLRVKYANEKYVIVNQNDQIFIKVEREHVKERTFIRFVAFATSKGHVLNYILFVSFR